MEETRRTLDAKGILRRSIKETKRRFPVMPQVLAIASLAILT